MSYDLQGIVDNLPEPQAPPDPASAIPSGAPPPSKYDLGPIVDAFTAARSAQANAINSGVQMGNADKAARAEVVGKGLGIPGVVAATDLQTYEQRLAILQSSKLLEQSPALQEWMIQNPDKAVMARDDFANMSAVERFARGVGAGFTESFGTPPKPGEAFNHPGVAATAGHMLGGVAGFMGEAYATPEATAGFAGGATLGALGGPAAPLTVPAMAWAGATAGAAWHVLRRTFQQTMDSSADIHDENGVPLNYAARLGLASINSVVQSLMVGVGGGVAAEASKGVEQTLLRMAEKPTMAAALTGYGTGMLRSAGHAGMIGGGLDVVQQASDQLARAMSNTMDKSEFQTWASNPESIAPAIEHILGEGMKWAAFGGTLHGTVGTIGLGKDFLAVRDSDRRQQQIQGLLDTATESKLRGRSPDAFREFMQSQTEGGPVENLEIPAEKILELYRGMRVDPYAIEHDPIFSFDPQFKDKLREAADIGGNVKISTADYAAHLAGTDVDKVLRGDIKPEGGVSLNERDAHIADLQDRYRINMEEMQKELARETGPQTPREAVYRDAFSRLMAEGRMSSTEADTNAKMVAAHYAARADVWNKDQGGDHTDAWEQYTRQSVALQRTRDENPLLKHYDVGNLDALINDVRAGKTAPAKDLYGPGLTEWLAGKGGLKDDGGELSHRDLDKWHIGKTATPRLIKPDGMTLEDAAQSAADHGFLPDVKTKLEAGEPVDLRQELLDALDRDQHGHGVRSTVLADEESQAHHAALDEIRRVLGDEGIDIKRADNETVKAALEKWKTKPEGGNEFEQAARRLGFSDADLKEAMDVIAKIKAGEATPDVTAEQRTAIEQRLADLAGREGAQSAGRNGEPGTDAGRGSEAGGQSGEPIAGGTGGLSGAASGHVREFLQAADHGSPRGSIQFHNAPGERINAVINLFRGADKSTFMHESAHLWLEELRQDAADPNAPQAFKADLGRVMTWLGVDHPDQIGAEQHEKFARGFEAYLMEGKAPSIELEGAFSRFTSWLTHIYRSLTGLSQAAGFEVKLDPEIRQVFDRMVASEDEVNLAREQQSLRQLFKSAGDANMTDMQFAAYAKAVSDAKAAAVSQVERKAIAAMKREREQWWKDESAKVASEVSKDIDARGDVQAFNAYRHNQLPDGRIGPMPKMDKSAIVKMFGSEGILKELNLSFGKIYADHGGLHPDMIGEMFGYKDGREFLQALMNLKRQEKDARNQVNDQTLSIRKALIDRETQARMVERHGDIMKDGSIVDEALDAVHNDRQGEVLAAELAALRSRARAVTYRGEKLLLGAVKPIEIAKAHAERIIADKQVRDVMNLTQYARAESKAGREAEAAILKGDYAGASKAKEQQLLAHALWRAAKDAKEQVEKDQTLLNRYSKNPTIKGMDQDYLDQIHGLLERFDFRPASQPEVLRRAALADWITRQEANEQEVMISDKLRNDAFRAHFTQLSVADMHDLADAVRNIAHLGRLKEKIKVGIEERELQAAKDWLTDSAFQHPQRTITPEMVKGTKGGLDGMLDRLGQKIRSINAPLMKIEQLCLMLDNGDSQGAWNTLIFRRAKDALFRRFEYENRIVKALRDLKASLPKDWSDGLGPHEFLPDQHTMLDPVTGLPGRFRRKDMLAMMLNMGNDGNYDRLTEGYGGGKAGWTRENVRAFIDQHATEHDWHYVQGIWDIFESFKSEIGAMQKRLSGVEPEWVKATAIDTPFGQHLRGGYFPAIYDLALSSRAEDRAEKANVQTLFGGGYSKATTPKGHTKARAEGYSAPLNLNVVDMIGQRMAQHIHDLAFREAVIDIDKLLSDQKVKDSISTSIGPEYTREFRKWLSDMASDRNVDPRTMTGLDRFLKSARTNMTAVGIGWRFTTFAKHATGALFNSIGEVGPKWMGVGVKDVFGNPLKTADVIEDIKAKSPEMRYRKEQYDRDVMASMQDLAQHVGLNSPNGISGGFVKMRDWWNHAGHWMVSEGDWLSALPTWQGAYKKALGEGLSESDAIYAGEQAVRRAHGSQSLIDRAGIQRTSEMWNALTMFYGFFNHVWNRQVDTVDRAKYGMEKARMGDWQGARADFATVAWRAMFYVLVPSIIEAAAVNGLPNEDNDESWFGWAGRAVGEELCAGVPILRDLGKATIERFAHGRHGLSVTPLQGGAETLIDTLYDLSSVFDNDRAMSDKVLKKLVTSGGILSGLGTGAPAMYAQYVWDVLEGKETPEDAQEFTRHLLLGAPPKH